MKQKTVIIENNSKTTIIVNLFKSKRTVSVDSGESRIENMYPEEIDSLISSIKASFLEDLILVKEVKENTEVEITVDKEDVKDIEEQVSASKAKLDVEIEGE